MTAHGACVYYRVGHCRVGYMVLLGLYLRRDVALVYRAGCFRVGFHQLCHNVRKMLKMGRFPALIRRPWHCDGPEEGFIVVWCCYFIAGGAIVVASVSVMGLIN